MMNQYYHDFSVTFNVWFVVAPIFVAAMAVVGTLKYKLNRRQLRISTMYYGDKLLRLVWGFDLILTILIFKESWAGACQFVANHLGTDSAIYTDVVAFLGIFNLLVVLHVLMVGAGKVGQWAKCGYLMEEIKETKEKNSKITSITSSGKTKIAK